MFAKICNRKGCEEVRCPLYIIDHGYICNDCKKEFEEVYIHYYVYFYTIGFALSMFMGSPKVSPRSDGTLEIKKNLTQFWKENKIK
jgi:hypothetical protein